MKKNILGEDGCINRDGLLGSPAYIFNINDNNFWDNIENGILPLVQVLIKHHIETFGSCQGHFNLEKKYNGCANVRYYVDDVSNKRKYIILKRAIKDFNNKDVVHVDIEDNDIKRETNIIEFRVSPEYRAKLNDLILEFSKYLDEYLTVRHY